MKNVDLLYYCKPEKKAQVYNEQIHKWTLKNVRSFLEILWITSVFPCSSFPSILYKYMLKFFFFLMYIAALTLYFAKFPFCVLTWCALWTYNSLQLALLSRGL